MIQRDPVREAHKKCVRALEVLSTDGDRRRVIQSLAILLGMAPFESMTQVGGTGTG